MAFRLAASWPLLAAFGRAGPHAAEQPMPATPAPAVGLVHRQPGRPLARYAGGSFWKNRRQSGEMLGIEASVDVATAGRAGRVRPMCSP